MSNSTKTIIILLILFSLPFILIAIPILLIGGAWLLASGLLGGLWDDV